MTTPESSPVSGVPADTRLRERIAEALHRTRVADGNELAEFFAVDYSDLSPKRQESYLGEADAVLAVGALLLAERAPTVPDADGLAQHVARRLAELDRRDWGGDHGFVAEAGVDEETDAFVDLVVGLIAEREASLRAERDVARREQLEFARKQSSGLREFREALFARLGIDGVLSDNTLMLDAVSALASERDALAREVDRLKRDGSPGVMHEVDRSFYDLAIKERDFAQARETRLRRERDEARAVASRPAIPDGAAVDAVARHLFRSHVSNSYGAARADRMWEITLDDSDRDYWRTLARDALAEAALSAPTAVGTSPRTSNAGHGSVGEPAGAAAVAEEIRTFRAEGWAAGPRAERLLDAALAVLSAPATDPAPAADSDVRALLVHPAAWDGLVTWLEHAGLTVDPHGSLEGIPTFGMGVTVKLMQMADAAPAAPQATADPAECGWVRNGDSCPGSTDEPTAAPVSREDADTPLCGDCGTQPAGDPKLTINDVRVCTGCWREAELAGFDDETEA